MKFSGTVIILDPCTLVKSADDWYTCSFGAEMSALGFTQFLYMDVGSDGTKQFSDKYSGELLGSCCTDCCVLVALYFEELLRYNPLYSDHIKYPQNVMILHDFAGEITYDEENAAITGRGNINFTTA